MTKAGMTDFFKPETVYSPLPRNSKMEAEPVELSDRDFLPDRPIIDERQEQRFSLHSILLASNQSKIDFLSLINLNIADGVNDLIFLQNIPWYQIDIKVFFLINIEF